jgi:hypothetical protein
MNHAAQVAQNFEPSQGRMVLPVIRHLGNSLPVSQV